VTKITIGFREWLTGNQLLEGCCVRGIRKLLVEIEGFTNLSFARTTGSARARLLLEGHGVHDFNERKFGVDNDVVGGGVLVSGFDGEGRSIFVARAALSKDGRVFASGFLAGQLTLRLRAESRSLALPCALGLLAERRAVWLGGSASGAADSGSAHSLTSRAVFLLAHILRASHRANRLFAMNLTLGTFSRLAVHLALGASADWVALCRANGIITKPFALRVALGSRSYGHEGNDKEK